MKIVSVKCPECGGTLNVDESQLGNFCYCNYCGAKLYLDDNSYKTIHIYRDETKIRETESEERIKMKKMDIEEQIRKEQVQDSKNMSKLVFKAAIAFLIMFFVSIMMGESSGNPDSGWFALTCLSIPGLFGCFCYAICRIVNIFK